MGLKITILDGGVEQRLKVEGKLAEPWASELELAWNQVRREGPRHQIVVDLSEMTFIDPRGEATLVAMITGGARLTAKGVYCEYVVEQLMKSPEGTGSPAQAERSYCEGIHLQPTTVDRGLNVHPRRRCTEMKPNSDKG